MPRRGECIYKRKDGRWEARYIHHYENGRAKYRFLYAHSYAEVKAKRNAELAVAPLIIHRNINRKRTFENIAQEWLRDIQNQVKESTLTRYERNIRVYLLPLFKNQPLQKLNIDFLKNISEFLLEKGGKNGTQLSAKTVGDILCVLKAVLKYAGEKGYISVNENSITLPKKNKQQVTALPEEYRRKIEERLWSSEDTVSLGILFTLYTGVRIGELCGLRWSDIDFAAGLVQISRTVERISDLSEENHAKTKVILSAPKTAHSKRIIPLPRFLIEHLEKFRSNSDVYIITGTNCFTEPHQFYLRYKTFLRRTGVPEYTFHALRHTFATRCVELGFDAKSLSEILGHSNVGTTLSLYVHPSLEQKRSQMERLYPKI